MQQVNTGLSRNILAFPELNQNICGSFGYKQFCHPLEHCRNFGIMHYMISVIVGIVSARTRKHAYGSLRWAEKAAAC